jgi:hypothetical protein
VVDEFFRVHEAKQVYPVYSIASLETPVNANKPSAEILHLVSIRLANPSTLTALQTPAYHPNLTSFYGNAVRWEARRGCPVLCLVALCGGHSKSPPKLCIPGL